MVFGLPGDQTMYLLDAFYDADVRWISTRHEQGTTYMADGYARATGRPGVACVVPGVGVYNAALTLVPGKAFTTDTEVYAYYTPGDAAATTGKARAFIEFARLAANG